MYVSLGVMAMWNAMSSQLRFTQAWKRPWFQCQIVLAWGASQVTDEVMYTGLIEMQEGIDGGTEEPEEAAGDTDTTAPILSEVTAVTTPSTDSTPNYTFS